MWMLLQAAQTTVEDTTGTGANMTLIIGLLIVAGLFGVATWFFFLWAIGDKQFENVEETAKRIVELDAKS